MRFLLLFSKLGTRHTKLLVTLTYYEPGAQDTQCRKGKRKAVQFGHWENRGKVRARITKAHACFASWEQKHDTLVRFNENYEDLSSVSAKCTVEMAIELKMKIIIVTKDTVRSNLFRRLSRVFNHIYDPLFLAKNRNVTSYLLKQFNRPTNDRATSEWNNKIFKKSIEIKSYLTLVEIYNELSVIWEVGRIWIFKQLLEANFIAKTPGEISRNQLF